MKVGRNDPCPCGSGKKYKFCCYNKIITPNEIRESNILKFPGIGLSKDLDDEDEYFPESGSIQNQRASPLDEDREMQINLQNMIYNFHKGILIRKPHIKSYLKARQIHQEITNSMVDYFQSGNFNRQQINRESKSDFNEALSLEMLECDFDLSNQFSAQSFYDTQIYKAVPGFRCITEDFIESRRYRKPEKTEFLNSMLNSYLGLFEVTKIDIGEGYAYLKDVFTGKEFKMTDIGISGQQNFDKAYFYTRIISYRDVNFSTGLNYVIEKTDKFIIDHIKKHRKTFSPANEFIRFTQLYNYLLKNPEANRAIQPMR